MAKNLSIFENSVIYMQYSISVVEMEGAPRHGLIIDHQNISRRCVVEEVNAVTKKINHSSSLFSLFSATNSSRINAARRITRQHTVLGFKIGHKIICQITDYMN